MFESNPEVIDVLLKRKINEVTSTGNTCQSNDVSSTTTTTTVISTQTAPSSGQKPNQTSSLVSEQKQNALVPDTNLRRNTISIPQANITPQSTPQGVVMRNQALTVGSRDMSRDVKVSHRQSVPVTSEATRYNGTMRRYSQTPHAVTSQTAAVRAGLQVRSTTPFLLDPSSQHAPAKAPTFLKVPSMIESKEGASNSSLSSGYFGSSRSGTTSPTTPEVNKKWYMESPPGSPPSTRSNTHKSAIELTRSFAPAPFQMTSSLQRPLGVVPIINVSSSTLPVRRRSNDVGVTTQLPVWNVERWRHWEEVARQRSEDLKQQETLV